jgi:hypothetical protein
MTKTRPSYARVPPTNGSSWGAPAGMGCEFCASTSSRPAAARFCAQIKRLILINDLAEFGAPAPFPFAIKFDQ